MSDTAPTREREADDTLEERSPKRTKLDDSLNEASTAPTDSEEENLLPPSHVLLGIAKPATGPDGALYRISEQDVGISEYIASGIPGISGIIKQRFTDFLVYEVDLDYNVVHIKSLDMPESSPKKEDKPVPSEAAPTELPAPVEAPDATVAADQPLAMEGVQSTSIAESSSAENPTSTTVAPQDKSKGTKSEPTEPWPTTFDTALTPFLSEEAISQLKTMFLEGQEPPRVSDGGWGARPPTNPDSAEGSSAPDPPPQEEPPSDKQARGRRGRERGARGARGGGRGGRGGGQQREDTRKVLSNPMADKATRTALHQAVRELFKGKLESETDSAAPGTDEGSRIAIKWGRKGPGARGGRGGGRGGASERAPRGTFPPYIHFTLQKTNRDTQDALSHLSRILHVNPRELSVAGTKDKRGVTVQRVALKRNNKTVEDVWRLANGQGAGRRTKEEALTKRGDRGIRIADLNYRKGYFDLGMLKGNAFVITLRNVQVESTDIIDRALESMKHKGFINYYGMQRFGTATIPTHSVGLALLMSDWHLAVDLILRKRAGEHPDVQAARDAWLVDGDLDTALALMPRRVVAERCILESFQKQQGDTRNAMGALSTIPRNLRLMYVHAYQSYVWNAIVSERIRLHGSDKAIAGDLVFDTDTKSKETEDIEMAVEGAEELPEETAAQGVEEEKPSGGRRNKSWEPAKVKTLTEEDQDKYSIFDVIMPLPGTDVAYPGGSLGERYREYLKLDGLDPDNFVRKQKEYTLGGSYRKIMQLPKDLSWSVLRYTDPDVPLAQADEDKLLGFDAPVLAEDGKFMALQIRLTLNTAAYATMALREVTKTDTSSHFQSNLTSASEDQKFKGGPEAEEQKEDKEVELE
ncbi:tRNA pseudouridine synthase D [Athelia psychrophila]|uniref:tRNA pseudouridine synthase D n=1 Tax=Athelia psychrophila TaxID=1759441 RepID=A0A166VPZ6_9AGAM|nr:tRNA pseudouridine synthase D [Fibularhizoctonia sp. CBS 109695]